MARRARRQKPVVQDESMNFAEPRETATNHPVWIDPGCGATKQSQENRYAGR